MNNERLRELYGAYTTSQRPFHRRDCPSPRELVGSFEPSYSRRRQRRIVDHMSECPDCREEFMILIGMQRSEASEQDLPAQGRRDHRYSKDDSPRRYGSFAWQTVAVMIGIGLALSSYLIVIQQNNPSGIQRANASTISLLAPRTGQTITRQPLFRWERNSKAEYYILELFDAQMMPTWSSARIRGHRLILPPEVASSLIPGGTYYWMVTGFTLDSERLESGLSLFRVQR
jgi:hypothetical protein